MREREREGERKDSGVTTSETDNQKDIETDRGRRNSGGNTG